MIFSQTQKAAEECIVFLSHQAECVGKYPFVEEYFTDLLFSISPFLLKYAPAMKFLKEYGADLNFVGLIGDEGRQRRSNYIIRGAYYYAKTQGLWKATPLIWWKTEDIWEYLKQNSIPIHPAYKKYGIERIGCVPCTGHKNWQLQLRKISPRLYEKIATDMGQPPLEIFEEVR